MATTPIHTIPHGNDWANKSGGEILSVHDTKAEAVAAGRKLAIAAKTEHRIHNLDGTIGAANSYGNDPHPPRG